MVDFCFCWRIAAWLIEGCAGSGGILHRDSSHCYDLIIFQSPIMLHTVPHELIQTYHFWHTIVFSQCIILHNVYVGLTIVGHRGTRGSSITCKDMKGLCLTIHHGSVSYNTYTSRAFVPALQERIRTLAWVYLEVLEVLVAPLGRLGPEAPWVLADLGHLTGKMLNI